MKAIYYKGFSPPLIKQKRHNCASLLLANGVSLKEIQEWLGHSDIATTADIYSHLDFKSKISSAYLMDGVLNLPEPVIKEDWGVHD
ncbi:MAG: tyrosine-type recombinase/integrase [Clostridia bacterium]|nr:tyrosine-type recombinase/integrase [Clostridia bacterium]MBR4450527.1 tyrosine-type recombinase/integrase [Clostridia bacterium]